MWDDFALLAIDLQEDFWQPDKAAATFPRFADNVSALLSFCRAEGIEVIHLRARFRPDRSDWMPVYRLEGRKIPCVEGTSGVKTLPFAAERPDEKVIVKQTFDGFHNPELVRYLKHRKKRFILTAGLVTSVCVLLTTISAMQMGFLTAIVEDCCADNLAKHRQTLETYDFTFERTQVGLLREHRAGWVASLSRLHDGETDHASRSSA